MPFTGNVVWMTALLVIELPSYTIRLCDGGFVTWDGNLFQSEDPLFGTIHSVDQIVEAVSDEAPSIKLTLLPKSTAAAADLFQPDAQFSRMSTWEAEIDPATGMVVGTPQTKFVGFVDSISLRVGKGHRSVDIEFMSHAERFFQTKEGNVLSPRFHSEVWPGETGLEQATGVQIAVPWGVASPSRGTIGASRGRIGGGGLASSFGQIFDS